jgi:hypothetical protein
MTFIRSLQATLISSAVSLLAVSGAQAATINKADYSAGKTLISSTYKTDKAACGSLTANAKDICVEEARAKEKNARAALEYSYTGKPADEIKVRVAQAESAYDVAKERCDDQTGNAKDVCIKEAKAAKVKAVSEAKLVKEVAAAASSATTDIRDADYKVAAEKCDALKGDAKSGCIATAKARFGKS